LSKIKKQENFSEKEETITSFIEDVVHLGFVEADKGNYIFDCNGYNVTITIDFSNFKKSHINYGTKIKVNNKSVCNFTKPEYFIQLECVLRLLKKGYPPNSIELEKTYKLGHREKGRLDVLVKKNGKSWAMIECKTPGDEFESEKRKVLEDGGQIFSYFVQDRNAKAIGIYMSKINAGAISFTADFIYTNVIDKSGDNVSMHDSWDKEFIHGGLFNDSVGLYELEKVNLRKKDLIDLTKETGRGLFNYFAEILRKYVISDKSNAFNIIFNLFVCKIYDEDISGDEDILGFQWQIGDSYEGFIARLSKLYYSSIEKYLNLKIDEAFFPKTDLGASIAIREFSFIEVNNKEDFTKNVEVLADVVRELQVYRIKYSTKHQFLGEFFENLLSTGIKQESGQFFTPIPLARFILRCLPIDEIIQKRIQSKEPYILPFIIDYACGSGHFLTEAMTEIEKRFSIIKDTVLTGQQKRYFDSVRNNYLWARDYIYGIEKDSRLAKTTKIAMFLNEDGDATVVSGDGLDDFFLSKSYRGLLKSNTQKRSIGKFDILVSNPPFSVEGFFNTIVNGKDNFALFKFIGGKSSEIECFFIERLCHLLADNAVVGIILPLSILNSNRNVYVHSRILLLLNFEIIGIVELREKALMATPTSVVIMFLRKKSRSISISLIDDVINNLSSNKLLKTSEYSDYEGRLIQLKKGVEDYGYISSDVEGLLVDRCISADRRVILAFSGDKKRQEYFMGYRFSKARGREGLIELAKGLLINEKDYKYPGVLSTRIRQNFENKKTKYSASELDKHITSRPIKGIVSGPNYVISNPSSILVKKIIKIESLSPWGDFIDEYPLKKFTLEELINKGMVSIIQGIIFDKTKDEVSVKSEAGVFVVTASNIDTQTGLLNFKDKIIYLRKKFKFDESLKIRKNDIIMSMSSGSLKHLGKVAFATENRPEIIGGFLNIIRASDPDISLALYFRFLSKMFREYAFSKKGQNINNISMTSIKKLKLALPKDFGTFANDAIKKAPGLI
jgi:type I restriction enzyme M protein